MSDPINLDALRAQYPSPSSDRDREPGDQAAYCVGGALVLGCRDRIGHDIGDWQFPGEGDLARALMEINPELEDEQEIEGTQAWEFANAIIETNDVERDYDRAWELVAAALAYRRRGEP